MRQYRFLRGPTPSMLYSDTTSEDFHRSLDEKLELLQQLSDDTARWLEDEEYASSDATGSSVMLPFEDEEENADACEACVYDPTLFLPSSPTRGTMAVGVQPINYDREKPLPSPPSAVSFKYGTPPPPPPTPGYGSPFSSPPSSPLSPSFPYSTPSSSHFPHTPPLRSCLKSSAPRPRTRSSRMSVSSTGSTLTHSTFPSISSTLSHLEERETDVEKRSGVYVTDAERDADQQSEDTFGHSAAFPSTEPSDPPLSPNALAVLSSRWSLDSTNSGRPPLSPVVEDGSASPVKTRKRDRLISFISRNRAGSMGKSTPPSPTADQDYADLVGFQPDFFIGSSKHSSGLSTRPSTSSLHLPIQQPTVVVPPLPISASTSASSSASTLPTPVDPNPNDVLPRSSFFTAEPSSYLPDPDNSESELESSPLLPTLPLPSPSVPPTSFLLPSRPQSTFPFLSSFRQKTRQRRKLVITNIPFTSLVEGMEDGRTLAENQRREEEHRRRYDAVVRWCESVGTVKRIDKADDGSVHVHWKDLESAESVRRVRGQVYINGVGTVTLTWAYAK